LVDYPGTYYTCT